MSKDSVGESAVHTIEATFENSLSAETATDWTRNLSRHLASSGGSSFIAWRRTVIGSQINDCPQPRPWGRGAGKFAEMRTLDFNLLPGLDAARIRANTVTEVIRLTTAGVKYMPV